MPLSIPRAGGNGFFGSSVPFLLSFCGVACMITAWFWVVLFLPTLGDTFCGALSLPEVMDWDSCEKLFTAAWWPIGGRFAPCGCVPRSKPAPALLASVNGDEVGFCTAVFGAEFVLCTFVLPVIGLLSGIGGLDAFSAANVV